jgi:heme exporter protein C
VRKALERAYKSLVKLPPNAYRFRGLRGFQIGANAMGHRIFQVLTLLTAALFAVALYYIFVVTPEEVTMGIVQKIFYFHVPSAYSMYLAATVCCIGSAGYLITGGEKWDAVGRAGAEIAIVFGAMVMTTGPLWGAKAWGKLWTFDPRLTTSLLSVLVYVSYVLLRSFSSDGAAERKFAAALGVLGICILPIIHFAVQKWGGQHPEVITGKGQGLKHPAAVTSLILSFVGFTALTALLVVARARGLALRAKLLRIEQDALDHELDDRAEVT